MFGGLIEYKFIIIVLAFFIASIVFVIVGKQTSLRRSQTKSEFFNNVLGGPLMIGAAVIIIGYIVTSILYFNKGIDTILQYWFKNLKLIKTPANVYSFATYLNVFAFPIILLISAVLGIIGGFTKSKGLKVAFLVTFACCVILPVVQNISYILVLAQSYKAYVEAYNDPAIYFFFMIIAYGFILVMTLVAAVITLVSCKSVVKDEVYKVSKFAPVGYILSFGVLPFIPAFISSIVYKVGGALPGYSPYGYMMLLLNSILTLSLLIPFVSALNFASLADKVTADAKEEKPIEASSKDGESKVKSDIPTKKTTSSLVWREPVARPIQLSTNKTFAKLFFLSIITFGIYGLVIECRMVKELNVCRKGHGKDTSMNYFVANVLLCWTGIVPLIWGHRFTKRLHEELEYRGIKHDLRVFHYWIFNILLCECLFIFPIIYLCKVITASNLICDHHNKFGDVMVNAAEPAKKVESAPAVEAKPVEVAPVSEPTPQPVSDPMAKIQKAKELLDSGAITQEEFDKIKAGALEEL